MGASIIVSAPGHQKVRAGPGSSPSSPSQTTMAAPTPTAVVEDGGSHLSAGLPMQASALLPAQEHPSSIQAAVRSLVVVRG